MQVEGVGAEVLLFVRLYCLGRAILNEEMALEWGLGRVEIMGEFRAN